MNCLRWTFLVRHSIFICCRGRDRIRRGGQLAAVQSSVVDPGHFYIAAKVALCCVYPVILTLGTRGSLLKISSPKESRAGNNEQAWPDASFGRFKIQIKKPSFYDEGF